MNRMRTLPSKSLMFYQQKQRGSQIGVPNQSSKRVGSAEFGSEVTDRQRLEAELSNQTKIYTYGPTTTRRRGLMYYRATLVISGAQQVKLNFL